MSVTEAELDPKYQALWKKALISAERKNWEYVIDQVLPIVKGNFGFLDGRKLLRTAESEVTGGSGGKKFSFGLGSAFFGSTIDLLRLTEPEIAQVGIGRKFQKPTVYEPLSVFENLELALKADRRVRATLFHRLSGEQLDRIGEVLTLIHLKDDAQREAGLLSHGQKQWLEIGMLLMQDPKLLLLDEPVAGMTDEETERTAELFLSLEGRHSLVVVEHDMHFVDQLTQGRKKVTVLHEGSVLAEGLLSEVQNNERVVEVYLGR